MKADTFYFPHDYHSHLDPKCSALISGHGMSGYGLYWSLIEILHEQGGRIAKFPKLYDGLAFQLKMDKETLAKQIEAMLHDYELLLQDDKYIWSERVLRNIAEREAKKMLRADAGKIGGINSGISRRKRSKTKQCFEANEANEAKERKGKEIKEKYSDDFLKFWTAYPNKKAKLEAFKAWSKCNGERPAIDTLLLSIEKQKQSLGWKKDQGQFIPHPATWLNQGRWDDDVKPVRTDPFN